MTGRVVASRVSHSFGDGPPLFRQLDFTIDGGETVAVCGPSGSGKSTLLSILATWVEPNWGRVTLHQIDRIGWVFQNPHGVPGRTAIDHVSFPLLAVGRSRRQAQAEAAEVLALFALSGVAERPFRELSGGEAQRVMLARAVAVPPDLLLVDEPTAQLDQQSAQTVSSTLANLAVRGSAVVVATHDPRSRAACDRVIDLAAPTSEPTR